MQHLVNIEVIFDDILMIMNHVYLHAYVGRYTWKVYISLYIYIATENFLDIVWRLSSHKN